MLTKALRNKSEFYKLQKNPSEIVSFVKADKAVAKKFYYCPFFFT